MSKPTPNHHDLPRREISPYFSLPNGDGHPSTDDGGEEKSSEHLPVTVSCASCERIVGDSSAFLHATRQMGTITLSEMVSVVLGEGGLKTSLEGEWDEFCNYKNITCGKCSAFLGKMYMATTAKLSSLQNKYTLPLSTLSFYHHASSTPSLPLAQTQEIYAHLHPSPEAIAESIDRVMTMCVMLHEKQSDMIRGLRKVATATGVEVDLEDSGEAEEVHEGVRDKLELLEALEHRMGVLDGLVARVGEVEGRLKEGKERKKEKCEDEEGGRGRSISPELGSVLANTRKRKSAGGNDEGPRVTVDLSGEYQKKGVALGDKARNGTVTVGRRTIPNSQSMGSLEVPESEDEDEDEEERIKSPIEKKRRGVRTSAKNSRFVSRLNA